MALVGEQSKKRIHFIGMGGIGMSGIARMYLSLGHAVQGSDVKSNEILAELERMGARVLIGHAAGNVEGANLVVYSSSIKENHPERLAAKEKGLKVLHRADALAELCEGKYTIAVTGTHGKTTTTAMIGLILKEALRDPSVVVGGVVGLLGGNAYPGAGHEIVIEADESDASFLKFTPDLEVITNIEKEHMDHYQTVERMETAYEDFVNRLKKDGVWIGCADDSQVVKLSQRSAKPAIFYGIQSPLADYRAENIAECPDGERGVRFDVRRKNEKLGSVAMKIVGRHNILNALAAIAAAEELKIPFQVTREALSIYEGAGRRFDVKYESADYLIVDDYAHHPTEIQKTLLGAKSVAKKRLLSVFQPHRYTRTQSLMKEFAASFDAADEIVITDIYAAGELPIEGITGKKLAEETALRGHSKVRHVDRKNILEWLLAEIRSGDLVLMMGAGDISQIATDLGHALRARAGKNTFQSVTGKVLLEEPLAKHTSLKIGGPADFWIEPEDEKDLIRALNAASKAGVPVHILGAGSNTLASDKGVRGAVISLNSPYFKEVCVMPEGKVFARAGLVNTMLIQFALDQGFGGFEFLSGIPGNVGGAVAMNAGSHGFSVEDYLDSICVITMEGEKQKLRREEIGFTYRSSGLKNKIIVEAFFNFPKSEKAEVMAKLDEYRSYRSKTQDLWRASAGCMFKNPLEAGCSAGKLIDEAGLKGFSVGKAQVSEKHANFIVNTGGASAQDVLTLIERVRQSVEERHKISLETEVKLLGEK